MNSAVAVAALALAGCGDFSNEDLRFLAALPTRAELRVAVPAPEAPPGALSACATRTAGVWLWAKPTSDRLNASVDWVLGLVEAVRRAPPAYRGADVRVWGPFPDGAHPGVQLRVTLVRAWPQGPDGPPLHAYRFEAQGATTPWTPIISGTFLSASASTGTGTIALFFDAVWALGMASADSPHGTMKMSYDRSGDPRLVGVDLAESAQAGFGLDRFDYGWAGYADGQGAFAYAFRDAQQDLLVVAAGFDAAGRGRGLVSFAAAPPSTVTGSYRQCWDENACLVYVDDPLNLSCETPPCSLGAARDCHPVTAPPF